MSADAQFYTIEDVCNLLQISKQSGYRLFNQPGFPAIKVVGSLRVSKEAFDAWVKENEGKR